MSHDQPSRQSHRGTSSDRGCPATPRFRSTHRRSTTTLSDVSARLRPRDRVIAFLRPVAAAV